MARARVRDLLAPLAVALVASTAPRAQETREAETKPASKVLAIRADWVLTLEGDGLGTLENAVVLIEGGKIKAVGSSVEIPPGAEVIEAAGMTVAPGFLDARSALPLDRGALAEERALAPGFDVLDAVDAFAREPIEEALRSGVTAVHVGPGRRATIGGKTAVLKLKPGRPPAELVVRRGAAVRGSVGAAKDGTPGPIARIGEIRTLREQFRAAKKYREAWEDYREARREFEEERAKRAKEGGKSAESRPAEGTSEPPSTRERPRRKPPRDASEEFGEIPDPVAPAGEAIALQEKKESESRPSEKKEEPLKPPDRPALEPDKEVLLEVLDRSVPLWLEAHRAEDILNALAVAKEFDLDFVLEGATEAVRIAGEIAAAGVPVVLGPPHVGEEAAPELEENDPAASARLRAAGVRFALGSSGTDPAETRFLALHAALAASAGLDPVAALRAVTVEAARLCGVGDRMGSIAPGKDADLVLFDGDPLRTGTKVRAVIVDGEVVYRP
ncbi:MAG TPA: amidohydrolase family protein [Planctomycetota bacterium]|jgi:imidazolonepropionase-like amidohydrolase|nr:amidohydrolase family protein [Planctomycetota bacterium]